MLERLGQERLDKNRQLERLRLEQAVIRDTHSSN
jgi:hypothetical protein